jgi:hypothetical protein
MKSLMRVRLELAQSPDFPEGSTSHGYEFVAPLKSDGHIDASKWNEVKDKCRVVRIWGDAPEEEGSLRHGGRGWRFDYEKTDDAGDEALTPGAFVSITGHDGIQRPFRVLMMVPWG